VFLLACGAVAHRKGKIEHGRHHPVRAVGLLLALRRTRFLGVAIAFLWELPIRGSR